LHASTDTPNLCILQVSTLSLKYAIKISPIFCKRGDGVFNNFSSQDTFSFHYDFRDKSVRMPRRRVGALFAYSLYNYHVMARFARGGGRISPPLGLEGRCSGPPCRGLTAVSTMILRSPKQQLFSLYVNQISTF
jgi:hypothetical protein